VFGCSIGAVEQPSEERTAAMEPQLTNPKVVAERGEKFYLERYKEQYERLYTGKFVAIDVTTGDAYVSDTAEDAIRKGQEKSPQGVFHLIRVGQPGAFRVSYGYGDDGQPDWVFG